MFRINLIIIFLISILSQKIEVSNRSHRYLDENVSKSQSHCFPKKQIIYLKPLIIDNKKLLSPEIMQVANAIYVIYDDFDLNGQRIIIPSNCLLQFEGGSLQNGILVGSNTQIVNKSENIIFKSIYIDGIWCVSNINSKWFDFSVATHNTADLKNISKLQNDKIYNKVIFNTEHIHVDLKDREDLFQIASNTDINFSDTKIFVNPNSNHGSNLILIENKTNVNLSGGYFIGDIKLHKKTNAKISDEWNHCICIKDSSFNVSLKNICISEFIGDGIDLVDSGVALGNDNPSNIIISNCIVDNNGRQGISIESGINVLVENCVLTNTGKIHKTKPSAGLNIEPYNRYAIVKDVKIRNCRIVNNTNPYDVLIFFRKEFSYNYNAYISFENCITGGIYGQYRSGVSISNCHSTQLTTDYCSNFYCEKSVFSDIIIKNSNNILVDHCKFKSIDQNNVSNFTISNCQGEKLLFTSCMDCLVKQSYFSSSDEFTCMGKVWGNLNIVDCNIINVHPQGKLFKHLYSANKDSSYLNIRQSKLVKHSGADETWNCNISFEENLIETQGMTIKCNSKLLMMVNNIISGGNNLSSSLISIPISSKVIWLNNEILKGYTALLDGNIRNKSTVFYSSEHDLKMTNYPESLSIVNLDSAGIKWGHFNQRPANLKKGSRYFCTDRKVYDSSISGGMLIYDGNNVWKDDLGIEMK